MNPGCRLLSATMLAASAAAVVAAVPVATPAGFVDATEVCIQATGATSVDTAKIVASGWKRAAVSQNGKPLATPVAMFGKGGNSPVIMTVAEGQGANACSIVADIGKADRFAAIADALTAHLGTGPRQSRADQHIWFAHGDVVVLELTGKPDAPGARITTMQTPEEKK